MVGEPEARESMAGALLGAVVSEIGWRLRQAGSVRRSVIEGLEGMAVEEDLTVVGSLTIIRARSTSFEREERIIQRRKRSIQRV